MLTSSPAGLLKPACVYMAPAAPPDRPVLSFTPNAITLSMRTKRCPSELDPERFGIGEFIDSKD